MINRFRVLRYGTAGVAGPGAGPPLKDARRTGERRVKGGFASGCRWAMFARRAARGTAGNRYGP
ncbi:hypothetical protein GCM10010106_50330 [Thermopolyspora flexuosa]|nr:hypothetical protein GCM10010106_50330 [Thermopolyspora flexuosa]